MNYYKYDIELLKKFLLESGCLTEEEFEVFWRRLQYKSIHTQYAYLRFAILFCQHGGFREPVQSAKEVIFLYKNKNSRLLAYFALKFLFKTLERKFPIFPEEVKHGATEEEIIEHNLTVFTDSEIERLIETSIELYRAGENIPIFDYEFPPYYPLALMLVSSIYGTRRGEFFILKPEWVKPEDMFLYIKALKHSVSRKHLIPGGLKEFFEILKEAVNIKPPDARYINTLFDYLQAKAQVRIIKRRNIHSIRKTLASKLLMDGVNPVFVNDFLRWKGQGTMMAFYANLDPIFIDSEIFKHHPYIKIWKEKRDLLNQ